MSIRAPIRRFFLVKKTDDNFLDEKGFGIIKNGLVYFKGTYWRSAEISKFKGGQEVEVLGVKNGEIVIKNK